MEDVQVAYLPFSYTQLTQEEIAVLPAAKTSAIEAAKTAGAFAVTAAGSAAADFSASSSAAAVSDLASAAASATSAKSAASAFVFAEKSPYTVTYDYTEVTDGGPTGPRTYQLPILYTVWPASKPLPTDLEYVVDYEVFIPYDQPNSPFSEKVGETLGSEAIFSALGYRVEIPASAPVTRALPTYSGELRTHDDTLDEDVPLANLMISTQLGAWIGDMKTDSNGRFWFMHNDWPFTGISLTITYQDKDGRWKIVDDGSTTPYTRTILANISDSSTPVTTLSSSAHNENEIHRAVNYFYNDQNIFYKPSPTGGLKITTYDTNGRAYYRCSIVLDPNGYYIGSSSISIYDYGDDFRIIGTTLHELGHASHSHDNPNNYVDSNGFIKESTASYIGWYLGEGYYKSIGWIKPIGSNPDRTGNENQTWTRNSNSTSVIGLSVSNSGWYSPLYIDMTDDYNQGASNTSRPNDNITGVSASAIWNIISTSSDYWTQVRPKIVNLVGTQPNFSEWIDNFDDSPVNN
jgi:hypothetical protein